MDQNSEILKETLSKAELHRQWVSRYYSGRNNKFYELAFDYIDDHLDIGHKYFLDAGCGNGAHSIRLGIRGARVYAADFSDEALSLCKQNVKENELENKITVHKENLLSLSMNDYSFDAVLCWGVLMHIAEIEKALKELCRVTKPGGFIVLCENSRNSLETTMRNLVKKFAGIKNTTDLNTDSGMECWYETEAGKFLVRKTNIQWLIKYLAANNMKLISHTAGQFTELYSWIKFKPLKNWIIYFNEFWFKYIKHPGPALANILIFKKEI